MILEASILKTCEGPDTDYRYRSGHPKQGGNMGFLEKKKERNPINIYIKTFVLYVL